MSIYLDADDDCKIRHDLSDVTSKTISSFAMNLKVELAISEDFNG